MAATGDGCRVWKCRLVENHTPGFPQGLENSSPFQLTIKLHYAELMVILEYNRLRRACRFYRSTVFKTSGI